MNIKNRIAKLKLLAQVQPTTTTTTTPTVLAPTAAPMINIRAIPGFRAQLFSAKPDTINDIQIIVNIINKYLFTLSQGKISFDAVWNAPSITGSEFVNSVKNLLNLAKWIYNIVKSQAEPYSIEGLKQIGNGLIKTIGSYSFPEPNASSIKNELHIAAMTLLSKFPTKTI